MLATLPSTCPEIETCPGVVYIAVRQGLRDDHTRTIDTEVELLPASFSLIAVLGGCPFAFANDRESRAIDDEMDGLVSTGTTKPDIEVLASSRKRRVVGGFEIDIHQVQKRPQESFDLPQWEIED